MEFTGIRIMDIDQLGLSQIYLNQDKIASVKEWFQPKNMDNFHPLEVHCFGDDCYTIVDGHTRAYVAYENGVSELPAVYCNDHVVTGEVGQMLYKADLDWCKRFGLSHIKHLGHRILNGSDYQKLWIQRCDRSYNLLTGTSYSQRLQMQELAPDLFLYGASEDLSILYFEGEDGETFEICRFSSDASPMISA